MIAVLFSNDGSKKYQLMLTIYFFSECCSIMLEAKKENNWALCRYDVKIKREGSKFILVFQRRLTTQVPFWLLAQFMKQYVFLVKPDAAGVGLAIEAAKRRVDTTVLNLLLLVEIMLASLSGRVFP